MSPQVFYQCQRCGNCCRWPGFVRLHEGDVERIADLLGLSAQEVVESYCELHSDRSCLVLKSMDDGRCIFLQGHNTCRIQAVKPLQCKGFPNTWNFPGWRDVCEAVPVHS